MIKLKKLLEKLTKSGLDIRLISTPDELEKFRFFVEEVHYKHKLAKSINSKFGAFYNNEMIGVIGYGPSSMPQISKEISGNFDKVLAPLKTGLTRTAGAITGNSIKGGFGSQ